MLGFTEEQVLSQSFPDFLHADCKDLFLKNFVALKKWGKVSNLYLQIHNSEQKAIDIEMNGRIGVDLNNNFKQAHCVLQDITGRLELEEELRHLATTDVLTGLFNRRAFFEQAEQACLACTR